MVLELAWILNADTREYFRIPVDVGVAVLAMLCQARVRPFGGVGGAFVFCRAGIDTTASLAEVCSFWPALALKLVNAFAFTRRGPRFVFSAENALKSTAAFMVEIASRFSECPLELMRDARNERDGGIGTQLDFFHGSVERKYFE